MAAQPKLVNKQFNSPIGLYSQQNIQEVLERESQILANGAVGINFNNPNVGKPSNLKNSAVLRMLEEEENRQRNGIGPGNYNTARPLRENITWPPPEYEHKNSQRSTFKDVVVPGAKRVAWPPPSESGSDSPYVEQNAAVATQGGPQFSSQSPGLQQNNYQAPAQQRSVPSNPPSNRPLKPLDVSTGSSSPLSSPLLNQSPLGFRPSTPAKGWAPVQSPIATPSPPSWQQQSSPHHQQSSTTSTTRYQTAHQSVSQQTFLGQQYTPSAQGQYQPQQQYQPPQQQYQPPQQQYQPPQQQYQPPQQQYQPPQQQYQPAQQQYQPPQQQYQPPQQQYQPPQQQYQPPQQQYQPPQQQYQPPQQQYQPPQQQYQPPQQQYQPPQQQYQAAPQQQYQAAPQQQYQAPPQQSQAFQPSQSAPKPAAAPSQVAPRAAAAPTSRPAQPPPPTTITLRPNAPVSQAPPPVVTSQPATATLKGGKHLRGDLKWPPEVVRQQFAEENKLRLELAQGPAVRPLRPHKDYTGFFAQHALNSTYPGYKIPPGTQFFRPE